MPCDPRSPVAPPPLLFTLQSLLHLYVSRLLLTAGIYDAGCNELCRDGLRAEFEGKSTNCKESCRPPPISSSARVTLSTMTPQSRVSSSATPMKVLIGLGKS